MLIPPPSLPIDVHMVFLLFLPTFFPLLQHLIVVHPCPDMCEPLATSSIMIIVWLEIVFASLYVGCRLGQKTFPICHSIIEPFVWVFDAPHPSWFLNHLHHIPHTLSVIVIAKPSNLHVVGQADSASLEPCLLG
jgi:hypothetical protein